MVEKNAPPRCEPVSEPRPFWLHITIAPFRAIGALLPLIFDAFLLVVAAVDRVLEKASALRSPKTIPARRGNAEPSVPAVRGAHAPGIGDTQPSPTPRAVSK